MRQTELQLTDEDRLVIEGIRGKGMHQSREVNRAHVLSCLMLQHRRSRRNDGTGRTITFCLMARSLVGSKDIALGGFYRRMAARRGGLIATMALARKLAAWYWRVMVKGDAYIEKGLADYDAQVLRTKQRALTRLAKELGQQLVPISAPC